MAKKIETGVHITEQKAKNDIIFIAAILVLAVVAGLLLLFFRTIGDRVIVTVDGKIFGEYSLNEERIVEIRNGEGYNILVIRDGKAYIDEASCPDGICSDHRPIEYSGESIICLPNKVVVEVHTEDRDQPDIIA